MTSREAILLLEKFRAGKVGRDEVLRAFQAAPTADLGFANVDLHRSLRKNFPEVIFGAGKTPAQVAAIAERLYHDAWQHGVEMLLDDRDATPGVKFNDADLIGLPLRLTIGPRSLQAGGAELKHRDINDTRIIPLDEVIPTLKAEVERLLAESRARVVDMPFPG